MERGQLASPVRFVVALLVAAILLSACGARWSDDQRVALVDRSQSGESIRPGEGGLETQSPETAEEIGATDGGSTQASVSGRAPGPATRSASPAGRALPCAAASNEKGVTDDTIVVGSVSSLTGPVPGLGSSAAAAVRAQVALRNATGGLCGRKVVLKEADDGTDLSRYRSALQELNPQVLGIPGGFALGDSGAEELINQLKIPIVNSPTGRTGELRWVFDINPDFPKPTPVIGKYRWLFEQGARTVSMAYIAVDQSRLEANIQRGLMEAAGLKIVQVQEIPLSTLSYDSTARAAANSKADYLWFIADENGQINMALSVRDTGYKWKFREHSYTAYGTGFIEGAGEAAEGATTWIRSLMIEEAATNREMSNYVEWMDRVGPGLVRDLFSIDSYVATKAFFDALEALPGPISREALVQQLMKFDNFEAAGMFAPINLGKDLSKGCFVGLIVKNGRWERVAPTDRGYIC